MSGGAQSPDRYVPPAGELTIGGICVSELADRYGTPLFVYDRAVLERKWADLRNALPPRFSIYYSIKANPCQAILRTFLELGAGLEIASAGEFEQALRAGCPAAKIVFAGPGKSEPEIALVLEHGIGEIHIESVREAGRVSALASRMGVRARVAVRINPGAEAEGGGMRMGGRPAAFGIDEENLEEVFDCLLRLPALDIRGVHLFSGTQILDYAILLNQYRAGIEIARRAARRLGRAVHTVDFGGGFGIPYFTHERELDMGGLRDGLLELMASIENDPLLEGTKFIVEPGRYLAGEAGIYLARVTDVKMSRGKQFVIVDGGMHHHLAASGNLGQTIKRNYPVAVLNKLDQPATQTVEIVGPLCTPLDVIGRGVLLPPVCEGDLIGVFQSGAYARSASPLGFLSHPTPAEVWVEAGTHRLVRRRGQAEDYLRDQLTEQSASFSAAGVAAF